VTKKISEMVPPAGEPQRKGRRNIGKE